MELNQLSEELPEGFEGDQGRRLAGEAQIPTETIRGDDVDALRREAVAEVEAVTEDPRLQRYRADYDRLGENMKGKCPWEEVERRLLGNGGLLSTSCGGYV